MDTPLKLRDGPLDIVKVVDEGSGYTTEDKGWTIRYCGGTGEGSGYKLFYVGADAKSFVIDTLFLLALYHMVLYGDVYPMVRPLINTCE